MDAFFHFIISLLYTCLWITYRHQTGHWFPSPDEFAASMKKRLPGRTMKAALVVLLYDLFHLTVGQKASLVTIDRFLLWMTVLMVVMIVIDPWVDQPLRRLGIRK